MKIINEEYMYVRLDQDEVEEVLCDYVQAKLEAGGVELSSYEPEDAGFSYSKDDDGFTRNDGWSVSWTAKLSNYSPPKQPSERDLRSWETDDEEVVAQDPEKFRQHLGDDKFARMYPEVWEEHFPHKQGSPRRFGFYVGDRVAFTEGSRQTGTVKGFSKRGKVDVELDVEPGLTVHAEAFALERLGEPELYTGPAPSDDGVRMNLEGLNFKKKWDR